MATIKKKGRPISNKTVQIHWECICGHNVVYTTYYPIRWKDLHKSGIKRKTDKSTGLPFLLEIKKSTACNCFNDDD